MSGKVVSQMRVPIQRVDLDYRKRQSGMAPLCKNCALCEHPAPSMPDTFKDIQALKSGTRRLPPKTLIYIEGEPTEEVFTLFSGWACRYKLLFNGDRQIIDFLLPGDMIGLPLSDSFEYLDHSVSSITNVSLCSFPAKAVLQQIRSNQTVTSRVTWLKMAESARAYERLTSLGKRNSRERLAHLIMELFTRLKTLGAVSGTTCEFPLTQSMLADTLGLTTVHINRVLRQFREEKIVTINNGILKIYNLEELEEVCNFSDTYIRPQPMLCGEPKTRLHAV